MESFKRSERVRQVLHQKLCELIPQIKDPRLGFVTIMEVKLSDDLSEAKVFFSVLGTNQEQEETTNILMASIPFFRSRLRKELYLRKVPNLTFIYDQTTERAIRIFTILEKISEENKSKKNVRKRK